MPCGKDVSHKVNKMDELRRLFEESAHSDFRLMQEMHRKVGEVGECIDRSDAFFRKISSDVKELRDNLSNTSMVNSCYFNAKNVIQELEKRAKENENIIRRLNRDVDEKNIKLSAMEENAKETSAVIREMTADISEKQSRIEDLRREMKELKESCLQQTQRIVDEKDKVISRMRKEIRQLQKENKEQHIEICELSNKIKVDSRMIEVIADLERKLAQKDNECGIRKQLSNSLKIRQLETMNKKSVEIVALISKLRREKVVASELLTPEHRNSCQSVNSSELMQASAESSQPG